jgi:Domain of unknown function (DUF4326)
MPSVLNIKKLKRVPPSAVYIGRANPFFRVAKSKWHNQFEIPRDGDRATVNALYEEWLRTQDDLVDALDELRGKNLVCWCAPLACHGDLLLRLANGTAEERLAWLRGDEGR